MKYLFLPILAVLLSVSAVLAQKEVTIKGVVLNNPDYDELSIEDIVTQTTLVRAKISINGVFTIKFDVEKTDFYKLVFGKEHYLLLILEPGEKVEIEADINNMYDPKIKGSKNSALVYNTFTEMQDFDEKIQAYTQKIQAEKLAYTRKYILENISSLSTLFFVDNLLIDEDLEIYQKLDESLFKLYPDNMLVLELHNKILGANILVVGSEAPEIDLPNPQGENIKLSSLRGKYVLIDFWAAWCGPCRRESPNMVKMYDAFHAKGFEIYSVSLDQTKADWEKAIEKDGLGRWAHVSDLKYWNSEASRAYGVKSIPFTVLIDKEGKIIATGLRGDDLRLKLEEIFN